MRRHIIVKEAILEKQRRRRGSTHEMERLGRPHLSCPPLAEVNIEPIWPRIRCVLNQSAISHCQHISFQTIFNPGQQPAHRSSPADPEIRQPIRIDLRSFLQNIDCPPQVQDELDLDLQVAVIEYRPGIAHILGDLPTAWTAIRAGDHDRHRPVARECPSETIHFLQGAWSAVLKDHSREGSCSWGDNQASWHTASHGAGVGKVDPGGTVFLPAALLLDVQWGIPVIFEQSQAFLWIDCGE